MHARERSQPTHRASAGFTLLEVLVVLAIVAVLMGLASSGLRGFVARRAADAAVADLAADYRLARSEAVRRSGFVTICRSVDGLLCSTPAAPGSWHDGWLVVADRNQNRQVDPGEDILRVQPRLDAVQRIAVDGDEDFSNTVQNRTYRPNGLVTTGNETLVVTADDGIVGGTRLFVISRVGRVMVSPVGVPLP